MRNPLSYPMLAALWIYQRLISPIFHALGVRCRHYPSCSAYSRKAIIQHGPWAGGWMTLARLLRCHPFERLGASSGVDNVPKEITKPPIWAPWRYGIWRGTYDEKQ